MLNVIGKILFILNHNQIRQQWHFHTNKRDLKFQLPLQFRPSSSLPTSISMSSPCPLHHFTKTWIETILISSMSAMNLNAKLYDTTLSQSSTSTASSSSYLENNNNDTTAEKIQKLFNISGKLKVRGKVLWWTKNEYCMKASPVFREKKWNKLENIIWPNWFNCTRFVCICFGIEQTTVGIFRSNFIIK